MSYGTKHTFKLVQDQHKQRKPNEILQTVNADKGSTLNLGIGIQGSLTCSREPWSLPWAHSLRAHEGLSLEAAPLHRDSTPDGAGVCGRLIQVAAMLPASLT